WQGLPLVAADLPSDKVERLEGRRQFGFRFRADRDRFDELLKGYEHLRFTISILVADSATPGENVFERTDDYYVYLRPSRISEAEVRTRNGWKPDAIVPRWIPMPSH
ncbi:MAG TPA: hypothetical protein VMF30_03415, partial [Pirellulales bacterium]|nr:hypothetical protein [Pirellulales bacterium]